MNLIPTALTAWRDTRSIEDAAKHHDRAGLALGVSVAFTFLMAVLGGTKYAPLVASIVADPNMAAGVGAVVAAVVAGFGHWAAAGAIATAQPAEVAGPPGGQAAPGAGAAQARVQTEPARSDDPARDLPLGG